MIDLHIQSRIHLFLVGLMICLGNVACRQDVESNSSSDSSETIPLATDVTAADQLPKLVDAMLVTIREPDEGQFQTAEDVVKHCINAMRAHDVDEFLRCFPIRRAYEVRDLAFEVKQEQHEWARPELIPGADFRNLRFVLDRHTRVFYEVAFEFWGQLDATPPPLDDPETPNVDERVAEMERRFDLGRLSDLDVADIQVGEKAEMDSLHPSIIVSEMKQFSASLVLGEARVNLTGVVGQLGEHWRVLELEIKETPPQTVTSLP